MDGVLLASAARVATTATALQQNTTRAKGLILFLDVTAAPAGETLTPQLEMFDPASGTYEAITAFAASAAAFTGEKLYVIYPGTVETAAIADQEVAGIGVPFHWRVNITHSSTGSWTYSLGYSYLY